MNEQFNNVIQYLTTWMHTNVLTWVTAAQWLCALVAFLLTLIIWGSIKPRVRKWVDEHVPDEMLRSLLNALISIGNLATFIILVQICAAVFQGMDISPRMLVAVSNLAVAGIVIRLLTGMMPSRALAQGVATTVWAVVSLHILGLLAPITDFLQDLSFPMGASQFTALGAIKAILLAAICLQAASVVSQFVTRRIESITDLSPSLRVLMIKAVKIALFTAAILFALSSVGIDLTSLAIFSSALGVGIGFGLKTIFSNYVAGVLLLMDNSIKPGDTIEVGSVFGIVRDMHGRYCSVLTRDGKEYLIPNEQLIASEVINWTYSDTNVRLKIPVGIAYESDLKKAMELIEKATDKVGRVLRQPAPAARLMGFGDNSVDLQLRVWIADADKGVANVRSEILVNVWNLFHENGIALPFPQRDVLLKADSQLTVKIEKDGEK
ncbi:MAG: mechanosensitive ion channel [Desulfobacterales bacterium]|nr:mechanosensitive ion channel [Desulfobacterales bacterium]